MMVTRPFTLTLGMSCVARQAHVPPKKSKKQSQLYDRGVSYFSHACARTILQSP
jgi:hypothetical protein